MACKEQCKHNVSCTEYCYGYNHVKRRYEGCFRTVEEVRLWNTYSTEEQKEIKHKLRIRKRIVEEENNQ